MKDIIFEALRSYTHDPINDAIIFESDLSFNIGFVADLNKDVIELPVCCLPTFLHFILHESNSKIFKYILINDTERSGYKTINPCIKTLFDTWKSRTSVLTKIKQDSKYIYGSRNLILDSNKNILYVVTVSLKKEDGKYKPIKLNCRLNNIVYEQDDALSKFIKGKMFNSIIELNKDMLPVIFEYTDEFQHKFINGGITSKFDIIINNMEDIIYKPFVPSIKDSSETINNFLKKNVDEILNTF